MDEQTRLEVLREWVLQGLWAQAQLIPYEEVDELEEVVAEEYRRCRAVVEQERLAMMSALSEEEQELLEALPSGSGSLIS